ncbi:MAG: cupin domain-containing protein [Promethearchaeota archaeon]
MGNQDVVPFGEKKEKPWGYERPVGTFRGLNLKELFFVKGKSSSLHYHTKKDEIFYIISGRIRLIYGDKDEVLEASHTVHITPGTHHQFHPIEDTLILEMSTQMWGDIVRIKDAYNRSSEK